MKLINLCLNWKNHQINQIHGVNKYVKIESDVNSLEIKLISTKSSTDTTILLLILMQMIEEFTKNYSSYMKTRKLISRCTQ